MRISKVIERLKERATSMITSIVNLKPLKLLDILNDLTVFSIRPIFLNDAIFIRTDKDDSGYLLECNGIQYRDIDDIESNQFELRLAFEYLQSDRGTYQIKFNFNDNKFYICHISGDSVSSGSLHGKIFRSNDGIRIESTEAEIDVVVINDMFPKNAVNDLTISKKVKSIVNWLNDSEKDAKRVEILTTNVSSLKNVSSEDKQNIAGLLKLKLENLSNSIVDAYSPEFKKLKRTIKCDFQLAFIGEVNKFTVKNVDQFDSNREHGEELRRIVEHELGRIYAMFDFKSSGDITRTIKKNFNSNVNSFVSYFAEKFEIISFRRKVIAIIENLIELLSKRKNTDAEDRYKSAVLVEEFTAVLEKMKATVDSKELILLIFERPLS